MKEIPLHEELNCIKIKGLQTTAFGMSLVSIQNNKQNNLNNKSIVLSSSCSLMRKNLGDLDNLAQLSTLQKIQLLKGMIVHVENSIRDEQKTLLLLRIHNTNKISNYCDNYYNSQIDHGSKQDGYQGIAISSSQSDKVNQKCNPERETIQQQQLSSQQFDRTQAEIAAFEIQTNTQLLKSQQEEIVMNNLKAIKSLELELIKAKAERNIVSEYLEDVKYELIDSKAQLSAYNAELAKQDFMIQNLQAFITQLTKKGISSIGNFNNRSNINVSRMDTSSVLNSSVITDVKQSLSSLKAFLQNAYSKIVQQQSSQSQTFSTRLDQQSMSQPQQYNPNNSHNNNILSGIDLQ